MYIFVKAHATLEIVVIRIDSWHSQLSVWSKLRLAVYFVFEAAHDVQQVQVRCIFL